MIKVKKYESKWKQKLDEDHSSQLVKVMSIINERHKDELEKVLCCDQYVKNGNTIGRNTLISGKTKPRMVGIFTSRNL